MKKRHFEIVLIVLMCLSNGFSQTLKVLDGDSVYTQVLVFENLENYNNNASDLKMIECVLNTGDTVELADYLAKNHIYPSYCRENGFSSNKTFLTVKLNSNKQVDSVKLLRSYCTEDALKITNEFQTINKIFVEKNSFIVVVNVNVRYRQLALEKSPQPNKIAKRRGRKKG
jgi:hypothetical protein